MLGSHDRLQRSEASPIRSDYLTARWIARPIVERGGPGLTFSHTFAIKTPRPCRWPTQSAKLQPASASIWPLALALRRRLAPVQARAGQRHLSPVCLLQSQPDSGRSAISGRGWDQVPQRARVPLRAIRPRRAGRRDHVPSAPSLLSSPPGAGAFALLPSARSTIRDWIPESVRSAGRELTRTIWRRRAARHGSGAGSPALPPHRWECPRNPALLYKRRRAFPPK